MKKKLMAGFTSAALLASIPVNVLAEPAQKWQNVNVNELLHEQNGSLFNSENYDFVKYSQIESKLNELAKKSKRVSVKKSTYQSSQGHAMFTVEIADSKVKGKEGHQKGLRKKMLKSPEKAQDFLKKHPDFKVPVMINGSIHGTEFIGTDAVLQLVERFALDNDPETKEILNDHILIFNVVSNPDGRIDATRFNGKGIDLNRDFITQSQPETKHVVDLITEWNPMVFLDLHGYVKNYGGAKHPGLIEPCTPPHNPNYEYDLFSKWAMDQAKSMENEIVSQRANYENTNTATSRVDYKGMEGTYIPQRDDAAGWDDYPPIFTPMYAMYHGAYGYTLEAPTNDWDGVRWTYDAIIGALKFSGENKNEMIHDQIEVFKRGVNFDHPFHHEGFFPKAYILTDNQEDKTALQKAVEHLQANDITVSKAQQTFSFEGVSYPKGTYIVEMDQAKAGLANTMLWDGEDISNDTPAMYDISAWSLPELWGFEAHQVPANAALTAKTTAVKSVKESGQVIGNGPFAVSNSSVKAVELANSFINRGYEVKRGKDGTFYLPASAKRELSALVKEQPMTVETKSIPKDAQLLQRQIVTILRDGGLNKSQSHAGTLAALKRLGFHVRELTPAEVAKQGLGDTDVFIYSGSSSMISTSLTGGNKGFGLENAAELAAFKGKVTEYIASGGKYIAVGAGASAASRTLGLTNVTVNSGGGNSNGIVKVNYGSHSVTAGYHSTDYGFVYAPAWYTNTGSTDVLASYENSDSYFVAGHWRGTTRTAAKGQPVIVKEKGKDVLLIGLEPGFRDHTDYLFRLLSNSIFTK
ncbi:hypothetical protein GJU40_07330 [Bacillus lacus]|uniref:Peptidase M14 domain-containing protein n=1 Tax=Metabacillus lacus TaxID=1983721 RepID=A0A7X2IYT3_9BACI|nr:M14 family zinc carboxypeptidase [Metabacillus lacus]MRX71982.1 hypothetical protein [Metabacillus lacus]